jgi:hypothetical protein
MVGSIVSNISHGILFVMDPGRSEIIVPEYLEQSLVAATESCISVGTQAPCDGDTEVSLTLHGPAPNGLFRLGLWDLDVPMGTLVVRASDDEPLLECEVPIGRVTVSVWVDDHRWPTRVCINIEPSFEEIGRQNVHRI